MPKALIVAVREYLAAVKTKAFLITIILMPVFMGGSGIAYWLLHDRVDTTARHVAVIDHSGEVLETLVNAATERNENDTFSEEKGRQVAPHYIIEPTELDPTNREAQLLALSDRVRSKELHAILEIGRDVAKPDADPEQAQIFYYAENASIDDTRSWFASPLNRQLYGLRMKAKGYDYEEVSPLIRYTRLQAMGLLTLDESGEIKDAKASSEGQVFILPMVIMFLMFMLILMGAVPLGQAIVEEKTQRIAEVLIGSLQPFQLMIGKLIGSVCISLTVVCVYVAGAVIAANKFGAMDIIPYDLIPWIITNQVVAVFMFGSFFIAIGSACNDAKEIQSLQMPAMMPIMIPMFVWMFVLREPTSTFATVLSLVPTCTPILMLIRQASPVTIPAWQPWVGLFGMIVTTIISVWAAGRIFRIGLLMQGKAPTIAGLARWVVKG